MAGGDVLEVVFVHVGVHPHPVLVECLVVGRARQRCQNKEFEQIDRQFLLHGADIVRNLLRRVPREAQNVAGIGDDPLGAPGEKHPAVFVHPVLLLLGLQQIVRVDVFEPDEDPLAAGVRRLLDKVRDAVAEGVDLDDELQPAT